MTEKEQLEQLEKFGMVIPAKYAPFVLRQDPLWSLEHFQTALAIAESVQYNPAVLDKDFKEQ